MTIKTKFVKVAQSGKTIDGREIKPEWVDQMAKNYDPAKYGARIWLEHMRGVLPDGAFPAYGDVVSLKAEDGPDGSRVLLAELAPTPALIEMNTRRQKVFTSIEVDPNFAESGEAYLVGLAVTDTPASLGTELLRFSMQHRKDLKSGSDLPDTVISDGLELDAPLDAAPAETFDGQGFLQKMKSILSGAGKRDDGRFNALEQGMMTMAESIADLSVRIDRAPTVDPAETDIKKSLEKLSADLAALTKHSREPDPATRQRPPATGPADTHATDC